MKLYFEKHINSREGERRVLTDALLSSSGPGKANHSKLKLKTPRPNSLKLLQADLGKPSRFGKPGLSQVSFIFLKSRGSGGFVTPKQASSRPLSSDSAAPRGRTQLSYKKVPKLHMAPRAACLTPGLRDLMFMLVLSATSARGPECINMWTPVRGVHEELTFHRRLVPGVDGFALRGIVCLRPTHLALVGYGSRSWGV